MTHRVFIVRFIRVVHFGRRGRRARAREARKTARRGARELCRFFTFTRFVSPFPAFRYLYVYLV